MRRGVPTHPQKYFDFDFGFGCAEGGPTHPPQHFDFGFGCAEGWRTHPPKNFYFDFDTFDRIDRIDRFDRFDRSYDRFDWTHPPKYPVCATAAGLTDTPTKIL